MEWKLMSFTISKGEHMEHEKQIGKDSWSDFTNTASPGQGFAFCCNHTSSSVKWGTEHSLWPAENQERLFTPIQGVINSYSRQNMKSCKLLRYCYIQPDFTQISSPKSQRGVCHSRSLLHPGLSVTTPLGCELLEAWAVATCCSIPYREHLEMSAEFLLQTHFDF